MHVNEAALLKKLVDGEGEGVAHAKDRAECVGARSEVRDVTQELHRVTFFLERVRGGIGASVDEDLLGLELDTLTGGRGSDELASHPHARARGDDAQGVLWNRTRLDDDLQIDERAAVVHLDEMDPLAVAPRFHPAVNGDLGTRRQPQNVAYVTAFSDHGEAVA